MAQGSMHRNMWDAGFRIFPINDFRDGKCLCGDDRCTAPGKHPRASNWQHTPEWDEEQLENMEEAGWFSSGYGVLCRGYLVIDVDVRNGGEASYAALLERFPAVAGAGMIVISGRGDGGRHLYFRLPDHGAAYVQSLPEYPGLDFKASGYVVGPGSRHVAGGVYTISYGSPDDIDEAPADLLAALAKPDRHRATYDGRSIDVSHQDIADMLAHISPDVPYETWIRIGMAVHHATGGTGFDVWDAWSGAGEKYDAKGMEAHWHSFGRSANPVTLGTIVHHAEEGGWLWPVTFGDDTGSQAGPEAAPADGLPFDISGVDLTRPPGLTGIVAEYADSKSRRPRRHLAVGAALMGLGSIYGLHYTDDMDSASTNLMVFGVAGSRTGKESLEQAVGDIIRAGGMADAISGKIKSEQEIIRNLVRHQCAYHIIDEIGLELQKLKNARIKGGTPYLEGVIGTLISVFGKSNGIMALTGDAKAEIRKEISQRIAMLTRKMDEGETGLEDSKREAEEALRRSETGLERPFLSLIGFTTPVTFDSLMDFETATNGFVGRSIIFNERETAPRSKPNWRPPQGLPDNAARTIAMLASGGHSDSSGGRIEHYGAKTVIPTDERAKAMLGAVVEWLEDQAVDNKGSTGLESLYLGAYELVTKVSLILAVPEGVRTAEHVRWAFALIKRDVEAKARLVVANDMSKDSPAVALKARILNMVDGEEGETLRVIAHRLRRTARKEDVEKAVRDLIDAGRVEIREIKQSRGPSTKRYFLV